MSNDTFFQIVRYLLIAFGGSVTGGGLISEEQWVAIIGALGTLGSILWGLYVKWNTSAVLNTVIKRQDLPAVSSATGARVPPPSTSS